ncbi:MAG: RDD family protein [Nibricoccus sp.]
MNWYYAINGQRQGPVAQSEFEKLVSTGVITDQTLVWQEGMPEWKPYSTVKPAQPVPVGVAAADAGATNDETAVCVVSGKTFPKREMIQYEGKWVSAQHRDEFFQRLRQGMAPGGEGVVPGPYGYGGFWRRFCAKFIDGLILAVVSVPLSFVLSSIILGTWNFLDYARTNGGVDGRYMLFNMATLALGVVVGLPYAVYFTRKYKATPGKMAMGLQLLRSDGAELTTGRIVGRFFAEWTLNLFSGVGLTILTAIGLIGYVIAGFDSEKRTIFDRICDTRVIKIRQ